MKFKHIILDKYFYFEFQLEDNFEHENKSITYNKRQNKLILQQY